MSAEQEGMHCMALFAAYMQHMYVLMVLVCMEIVLTFPWSPLICVSVCVSMEHEHDSLLACKRCLHDSFFFIGKLGAPLQVVLSGSGTHQCRSAQCQRTFFVLVCMSILRLRSVMCVLAVSLDHTCVQSLYHKVGLPSRMEVFPLFFFFFFCHISIHERTAFALQETLEESVDVSSRWLV